MWDGKTFARNRSNFMSDSVSGSRAALSRNAPREASWKRYVERCAAGDQAALAALYDESSSLAYSVALRLLGNSADAEEMTLDVYTQVWRTAASYDQVRGSVTSWLVTLARSRAIDRIRSRASRVQREQPILDFTSFEADTASPEQQIAFNQRSQRGAGSAGHSRARTERGLSIWPFFRTCLTVSWQTTWVSLWERSRAESAPV